LPGQWDRFLFVKKNRFRPSGQTVAAPRFNERSVAEGARRFLSSFPFLATPGTLAGFKGQTRNSFTIYDRDQKMCCKLGLLCYFIREMIFNREIISTVFSCPTQQ
jgi:hypothetical protein